MTNIRHSWKCNEFLLVRFLPFLCDKRSTKLVDLDVSLFANSPNWDVTHIEIQISRPNLTSFQSSGKTKKGADVFVVLLDPALVFIWGCDKKRILRFIVKSVQTGWLIKTIAWLLTTRRRRESPKKKLVMYMDSVCILSMDCPLTSGGRKKKRKAGRKYLTFSRMLGPTES